MPRVLAWAVVVLSVLAVAATAPTDDPFVGDQWHLPHVGAFDAWGATQGGGMVVAVIDTGVDSSHPDLLGRLTVGIDLVEPGTPSDDPNGHGTIVAGVIAAVAGNGVGGAGVAPAARIMPVRVLDASGTGSSEDVAEGIRWATRHGADVINLSLAEAPGLLRGTGGIIGGEVEDAIREADASGVVVVAAAGNEGRQTTPYDATVPAIVVGASDHGDAVWPQSNRDERTVFAPGRPRPWMSRRPSLRLCPWRIPHTSRISRRSTSRSSRRRRAAPPTGWTGPSHWTSAAMTTSHRRPWRRSSSRWDSSSPTWPATWRGPTTARSSGRRRQRAPRGTAVRRAPARSLIAGAPG